jgi:hypothetical protein
LVFLPSLIGLIYNKRYQALSSDKYKRYLGELYGG